MSKRAALAFVGAISAEGSNADLRYVISARRLFPLSRHERRGSHDCSDTLALHRGAMAWKPIRRASDVPQGN